LRAILFDTAFKMGQNTSQPEQFPAPLPRPINTASYESVSDYSGDLSFTDENITIIDGIPIKDIPTIYKQNYNPKTEAILEQQVNSSSSSTLVSTPSNATPSLLNSARTQYVHGRGTFYNLAALLLEPHYLHPVDLTSSEFLSLITAPDSDAWISLHRPKLLHRVITRRTEAQRVLKEAGIPHWEMKNMGIFELMDERERRTFIKGWWRRKGWIVDDVREAMEGEMAGARKVEYGVCAVERVISDRDEDLRMEALEKRRDLETVWSEPASSEAPRQTLQRQQSFFRSLGGMFRRHTPRESSGSDEAEYSGSQDVRSRKLSRTMSRSIRSLRHLFEGKTRGVRRAVLKEELFVE
jgi:hypothetical protein